MKFIPRLLIDEATPMELNPSSVAAWFCRSRVVRHQALFVLLVG